MHSKGHVLQRKIKLFTLEVADEGQRDATEERSEKVSWACGILLKGKTVRLIVWQ